MRLQDHLTVIPGASPSRTSKGVNWEALLTGWVVNMRAAGLADGTIKLRAYHVRVFAQRTGTRPREVVTADLEAYLSGKDWKADTRRSHRASLVRFFTWMHTSGQRRDNPAAALPRVKVPRGQPRPAPRDVITRAIMRADDRTRLILLLAAHQGLRRGEIARVHTDDLTSDVLGEPSLRVTGKGGHTRVVPLTDYVAALIRKAPRGWVFPGQIDGHLSAAHIGVLARRVLPAGWTLHTLRHHFASAAYSVERDLRAVQELLGHASVATTQIYTAIPDGAKRRAVIGAVA